MSSLKASQPGLTQIKQAISQTGWKISSDRWLMEASKILEPDGDWQAGGPYAYGCSERTWERFLRGVAIRDRSFIAFCQLLGVKPEDVVESSNHLRADWGEALDASIFYGRTQELALLKRWILDDGCNLVTVLGIGGIGKTCLTVKLAQQIQHQFEYVFWRSLRNSPPLREILATLIKFLSNQQEITWSDTVAGQIAQLLPYLQQQRCLIVLDNFETVLQSQAYTGRYRTGYEQYGELLERIGETVHQSCLVLTSREKPQELACLEGEILPVRMLQLKGLEDAAGQQLLKAKGLTADENEAKAVVDCYQGNPLALKIAATSIKDAFAGNLVEFLNQEKIVFQGIRTLLERQFQRLTTLERQIMYWLAINREPISVVELQTDFISPASKSKLVEVLASLRQRCLIEGTSPTHSNNNPVVFTQQPVVMEYITDELVENAFQEIIGGEIGLFRSHALLKAQTNNYVRETQACLILQPLLDQLMAHLGSPNRISDPLIQILERFRGKPPSETGYVGGNIINLLCQLQGDLNGYDFSNLTIWQANLQSITAHNINFAHSDLARSIFTQTLGSVQSVAVSPDGNRLAAGNLTGQIHLWRVANGQPLVTCRGHTNLVSALAFSPSGQVLASSGFDQTIKLWDVETGECLKTFQGHTKLLWCIAFSPDGQIIASGSDDQTLKLWDVRNGRCLNTLSGHIKGIRSVAFSPDGQTVASGSIDQTAKLWDVRNGQCLTTLSGHTGWIRSVTFSPDSPILASGGDDRTLKLWNTHTGQCLNTLQGHTDTIWSVTFNADGQLLASSSDDRTIRLWDADTGQSLNTLQGHTHWIWSIAFSPDGQWLASGSFDQTVRLWDVDTGQCLNTLQGYANNVWSIAFAPPGEAVSQATPLSKGVPKGLGHVGPTSRMLASASDDQIVRLWDVDTGQCRKLKGHTDIVFSVAFSPNRQLLASGSGNEERAVRLWNVENGECLNRLRGHASMISSVAFSPDGQLLASSGADQTVRLWRVSDGQPLKTLQTHHTNWVWSVAFSPEGQRLATGSYDRTIRLWNIDTGECLNTLQGHTSGVFSVAFSPDGQWLASGSSDQTVRLWDGDTSQHLKTLKGHTNSVGSVSFSPDGQLLSSGGFDGAVKLWDIRDGSCLKTFKGHTNGIWSVSFSADGQLLASGSDDESIRVWEVKSGECLKILRAERPYEGMNIAGATGLTEAQKTALRALGAVEGKDSRR